MGQAQSNAATAMVAPSDSFFLMDAAKKGDVHVLALFLSKNPALVFAVSRGADRMTAWHLAAEGGHARVLRLLIKTTRKAALSNTFDPITKVVNAPNARGQTPLMLACQAGHVGCARLLISVGGDVYMADAMGRHALHHAAMAPTGGVCVALLLYAAGAWPDDDEHQDQPTGDSAGLPAAPGGTGLDAKAPTVDVQPVHVSELVKAIEVARAAKEEAARQQEAQHHHHHHVGSSASRSTSPRSTTDEGGHGALDAARGAPSASSPPPPLPRTSAGTSTSLAGISPAPGTSPPSADGTALPAEATSPTATKGGTWPGGPASATSASGVEDTAHKSAPAARCPPLHPDPAAAAAGASAAVADARLAAATSASSAAPLCATATAEGSTPLDAAVSGVYRHAARPSDGNLFRAVSMTRPDVQRTSVDVPLLARGTSMDGRRVQHLEGQPHATNAVDSKHAGGASAAPGPDHAAGPRLGITETEAKLRRYINAMDMTGRAALHYAAYSGAATAVESLVSAGADLEVSTSQDCYDKELPSNKGTTPLHLAAMRGHHAVVAVLMASYIASHSPPEDGALRPRQDPRYLVDGYGNTPYAIAQKKGPRDKADSHLAATMALLNPVTPLEQLVTLLQEDTVASLLSDKSKDDVATDDEDDEEGGGAKAAVPNGATSWKPERASADGTGGRTAGGSAGGTAGAPDSSGLSVILLGSPAEGTKAAAASAGAEEPGVEMNSLSEEPVPDCFMCPLTCRIFKEPVVAADGITYEAGAISRALATRLVSPITKEKLTTAATYPNKNLAKAIEYWMEHVKDHLPAVSGLQ